MVDLQSSRELDTDLAPVEVGKVGDAPTVATGAQVHQGALLRVVYIKGPAIEVVRPQLVQAPASHGGSVSGLARCLQLNIKRVRCV
jgi:hypothetical protein